MLGGGGGGGVVGVAVVGRVVVVAARLVGEVPALQPEEFIHVDGVGVVEVGSREERAHLVRVRARAIVRAGVGLLAGLGLGLGLGLGSGLGFGLGAPGAACSACVSRAGPVRAGQG